MKSQQEARKTSVPFSLCEHCFFTKLLPSTHFLNNGRKMPSLPLWLGGVWLLLDHIKLWSYRKMKLFLAFLLFFPPNLLAPPHPVAVMPAIPQAQEQSHLLHFHPPCACIGWEGNVTQGFVSRRYPVESKHFHKQHFIFDGCLPYTQLPSSLKIVSYSLTYYFNTASVLRFDRWL